MAGKLHLGMVAALVVAGTVGAAAANTTYTYTPANTATDIWSSGTDWSATPVGGATTTLTFVGNNNTVLANSLSNTNTDDISGAFGANIINLQGTGPASGAATITIAAGAGSYLDLTGSNPTINLNANKGAAGLTYNISAPITLSSDTTFQGNGNATFQLNGTISGSGNITKTGSSTLILGGVDTSYTGNVDIAGGQLQLGAETSSPPVYPQLITTGSLTVASGATLGGSGVYPTSSAFSGLYGDGVLDARVVVINYNGAAVDQFGGQINGGGLWKDGVGTLQLTNANIGTASFVNQGLNVNWGTLSLDGLPSTAQGGFNVSAGQMVLTGDSGVVAGSGSSQSSFLGGGELVLRPTLVNSSTDVSVTGFTAVPAAGDSYGVFRTSGAGTLVLDPNGNRSLTFTVGDTTADGNSNHSVLFTQVTGGADYASGSFIIAPATGLSTLGTTVRFVVLQASESGLVGDPTNLINGMTDANVIGQNNDVNKSGSFLTYVQKAPGTYSAGDPGFEAVSYNSDANNVAFYGGMTGNTAIEDVTTSGSLAANAAVFALRNSGQTIGLGGHILTIGDNTSNHAAGLMLYRSRNVTP